MSAAFGPPPRQEWVEFWRDGCRPVSPGCDNCAAHGIGLLPTRNGNAHLRLEKLNRQAVVGRWNSLVWLQDDSDVFGDTVDPDSFAAMVAAIDAAPDLHLAISTRYLVAIRHRAPARWLNGEWPANLGLVVSVSNQSEADRDIPALLILKQELGIPWVGARLEPLVSAVSLANITLQAHAHPKRRGAQTLNALTGAVTEGRGREPRHAPPKAFGALDWVILGGERYDDARPLHPSWLKMTIDECSRARVPLNFLGWGEWIPETQVGPDTFLVIDLRHTPQKILCRDERDYELVAQEPMRFFKIGWRATGASYNGRGIYQFPNFALLRNRDQAPSPAE